MLDMPITVEPVTPARLGDFLRLFEGAFVDNPDWAGCYCMFYHQTDPAAWKTKTGDQNRADKTEQIRCGAATGFLAYRAGQAIGWCNAGPRSAYPLLHADPDVAAPDADQVGAVVCFLIAPDVRGQGIARLLLDAACAQLAAAGYTALEAYPRQAEESNASK
jgi:GNAT superfamily N-acetyltransferase